QVGGECPAGFDLQPCQWAAGEHLGLGEVTIDHDCRHQRQSHPDDKQDDKLEGDHCRGEGVHCYAPGEVVAAAPSEACRVGRTEWVVPSGVRSASPVAADSTVPCN